ncbi:hypothetical protein AB733_20205 [Photobacterium swingsii]|uniref:hypothetical protein n=1 Tax=Photobacterium swingsii TaxID=680026 RepID=UPI0006625FDB|nr:hypothetical protein [Photobacterium swingsii]KMV28987.1 hypothetical protein AB733_20205 [Photobacterium swingsii]
MVKKDELNTKIATSRKNLNDLEKNKVELEELYKIFSNFIEVKENIRKVNDKISTFKSKLEGKSFTLSEKIKTLSVEKTKQKSLDGELRSFQEKIENSSGLYQKLALEKTYSINIKNVIEKYKSIVELRDSRVSYQDEKIKNYNHSISLIKNDRYPDLFESDLESLKVKVDEIKSNNLHILNLKEELETLTIKINDNGELNKEIKQLIKLGSDIVSKNKLSNCPLCKKNHGDFSTLAKRISNNPLIDNSFNELIKNKSDLENELRIVKKNVSAIKNDVISCFESIINIESVELENRRYKLFKSRNKLLEKSKELILIEDRISALTIETNGLENDTYISQLLSEVKSIEAVIANSRADLNISLESIKTIEKEIALLKTEVDSSQEQLKFLQGNVHYLKVVNYIETVSTVEDFKQDHINDSIFKLMDRIQVCKDEILSLVKQEKIIEEEISDKPLSDFVSIINDKSKLFDNLINFNRHVEQFFSNNFDKDLVKLEITDLHKTLSDESDVIKRDVSVMQMKLIEIEKIKEYKENVIPFLKHQKNYSDYVKYLDEKKFLEEVVSEELKRERRKLSNHIHDNVRSFFHQDLINSLYSKIDPHPKYKKISFECDFSNDKPRLDVFISGESGNIVPTLYFSSAQLNILSLSIFLAKALNVKDDDKNPVNCIFIDDPIQAMDSINILSVIDLFRSIVVNMGKQIILSTHDENFYNLLQKKIPEDLFKSRYIELESFGKVKKEA